MNNTFSGIFMAATFILMPIAEVTAANTAPVASDGTLEAVSEHLCQYQQPASWKPAVFDADSDPLTCRVLGGPGLYNVNLASDCSSVTYNPGCNAGGYSFTVNYVANDGFQDSNVGVLTVNVIMNYCSLPSPINVSPVYLTATRDTPLNWSTNTPSPCRILTPTQSGTLTQNQTEYCTGTYTPNAGFLGQDKFSYSSYFLYESHCAQDRLGDVFITVADSNPPPTAGDVNLVTFSGNTVSWTPQVVDPNGDTLICRVSQSPLNGSAFVAGDCSTGGYTPSPGFVGIDSFTYLASDGQNDSNPGTVTVAVTEPGSSTDCTNSYPLSQFSHTGKAGSLTVGFTGNIVSYTNKAVKVCPGTNLNYLATSTQGPVVCKVKNNTTRDSGSLMINDHIKCTDKPAGKDKVHFKVKSGVSR